jgi:hypothetical protein
VTLAGELRVRLTDLLARHADASTGSVDYRALLGSEEFGNLTKTSCDLRAVRPEDLTTADEQIAFWVNLYNALTLHGIVALDIQKGVGEVHDFFRRVQYDVGGDCFALVDIEHGVLRQNRLARNLDEPVWVADDRRHRWMASRFDPRMHFALTCGTRSCPPIRVWAAARLDAQLDLAARAFINTDVEIDAEDGIVRLSRLFFWYADDLGNVLDWLLAYLDPGPVRDWLHANRGHARIEYRRYDWDLNDRAAPARPS